MTEEIMTAVTDEVFDTAVDEALVDPAVETTNEVIQAASGNEAFIYFAIGAAAMGGAIAGAKLIKHVLKKTGVADKISNAWQNRKIFRRKVKAVTQTTYYVPDDVNQDEVEE